MSWASHSRRFHQLQVNEYMVWLVHTGLPVSASRLCLTYNLCYSQARGSVTHSVRAGDSTAVARAAEAMSNWQADDNGPTMLCYVLDHL